jgi:CPA2 family monovalent cation:H+ antiporter-2
MIAGGIAAAFALGVLAHRLRLPPALGYGLAGMIAGPHALGFAADPQLAIEFADVGLILIMFGIGLKFPARRLSGAAWRAAPVALGQMAMVTLTGAALGFFLGLGSPQAPLFGFCLAIAAIAAPMSEIKAAGAPGEERDRLAVAWLTIHALGAVALLIAMPYMARYGAGGASFDKAAGAAGIKALEIGLFMIAMLIAGRRIVPALMVAIAKTRSRELFALGVTAIATAIAYAAYSVFGAGIALGAFIAGLVLSEAELGQRAAEDITPLREAYAAPFYIALGMVFDPGLLTSRPGAVAAVAAIAILGNGGAVFLFARAIGAGRAAVAALAGQLARTGEFPVLIASVGLSLGLMSEATFKLIAAGVLISLLLNPAARFALTRLPLTREAIKDTATADAPAAKSGKPAGG